MNSSILDKVGLGGLDPGFLLIGMAIVFVILLIIIVMLIVQIQNTKKLRKRLDKFLVGKDGASLEQDIIALCEDNKFLKIDTDKNKKNIDILFQKMQCTYQKMGLIKYDAFQQMGGQLSFSLALLDESDNGFIINSVHSSDGCYSYTKEIVSGESDVPLSTEEQKALEIAMGKDQS